MTEQEQMLAQVQSLKLRLFDAGEQLQQASVTIQQLQTVLGQIAQVANIQPDETGNIALETIVETVRALAVEPDHGQDAPESELLEG